MRRRLWLLNVPLAVALTSVACLGAEDLSTPESSAKTTLVVIDHPSGARAFAFDSDDTGPQRVLPTRETDAVYVLTYAETEAELFLQVDASGAVKLDAVDGRPLPLPQTWSVRGDGALEPLPLTDFAERMASVRLARRTCPKLERRLRTLRYDFAREPFYWAVVLENDPARVLVALDEVTNAPAFPRVTLRPAALATVTTSTVTVIVPRLPGGRPRGFAEPDGTVWMTLTPSTAPTQPLLCRFRGVEFDARACTPMQFRTGEEPVPAWAPFNIVGQRTDGVLEIVASVYQRRLYAWREGDETWRILYEAPTPPANGWCDVGVPTLTLRFDGPRTGLASLHEGPLRRFDLRDEAAPTRQVFQDPSLCRSVSEQDRRGRDVLLSIRRAGSGQLREPAPELWVRESIADDAWAPRELRVPNTFYATTGQMLTRLDDRLLTTLTPRAIAFLDVDQPGAARVCGPIDILSAAQTVIRVGNKVLVTGTTDEPNGAIEWLDVVED